MKKRMVIAAVLVAALAGGSALARAQAPRGGPAGDLGLRGIELTDAQREQVRSIMESQREEFADVRTKLGEARRAFAAAARGGAVDEAAIRTQSTAVANAMADEAILQGRVRSQVHALLTAEQQQQLKDREAEMQQRMQEREEQLKQRQQRRPPQ